jgi:hypothetical protein
MRTLAILLLAALSFSAAAHLHCALEACEAGAAHAEDCSSICDTEQVCLFVEGPRTSSSVVISGPVPVAPMTHRISVSAASPLGRAEHFRREAPLLSLLQTYLI